MYRNNIITKLSYKRSISDFNLLVEKYKNGTFSVNINGSITKYNINFLFDNSVFLFVIDDTFPFHNPKLYINHINYFDILKVHDEQSRTIIKNDYDMDCLCCSTILCYNNWSPAIKLDFIIDEYIRFKNIICYCYNKKKLLEINKENNYIFPQEIIDHICSYLVK